MTSDDSQVSPSESDDDTAPAPGAGSPTVVTATRPSTTSIRVLAIIVMVAGAILLVAGTATWFLVRDQLSDEKIVVSGDAEYFAGDSVDGPLTAFSEANTIREHALKAGDGKTYAELDQDDPARPTVMTASFLRASLFTSVLSFGVALFAAGLGVMLIIIGFVLHRLGKLLSPAEDTATAPL